jgi:uncharacterized repeat protein (TIGR03803 family)
MKNTRPSQAIRAAVALAAVTLSLAVRAQAQYPVLFNFPNNWMGGLPESSLLLDGAGNLYGTTVLGGGKPNTCTQIYQDCGTVFELSPGSGGTWNYHLLHGFTGDANGGSPFKSLVQDAAGNLYGTTIDGGDNSACSGGQYYNVGCGVVFELSKNSAGQWKETVLYTFKGGTDGANPFSDLLIDAAGNLYGTTQFGGGLNGCSKIGCGVAYRLSHTSTGWHETVLRAFASAFGHTAYASGLVQDASGNLYGTTFNGGNQTCSFGCGTVFQLSPTVSGPWNETVLYQFAGGTDGEFPASDLILDASGNLYGTTEEGGTDGVGTAFELSPGSGGSWTETQLFSFNGVSDAKFPRSGLLFDTAGNLYGSSIFGGGDTFDCPPNGCGVVYKLSPGSGGWSESVLYSFNPSLAYDPNGIIRDAANNLYGTAQGGTSGGGVVFRIITQ